MISFLALFYVLIQASSLNLAIISSNLTIPYLSDFLCSLIQQSELNSSYITFPFTIDLENLQMKELKKKMENLQIQAILDITFNLQYTQKLSYLDYLIFVAYRSDFYFSKQNIYWIMPSYQQEGQALQSLFQELNFRKITYVNQQEARFYKAAEFLSKSKQLISTSVNIPLNSYYGLNKAQCNNSYIQERLMVEVSKAIRIYGSSYVFMQADVCWQAYILNFATFYKLAGDQYA